MCNNTWKLVSVKEDADVQLLGYEKQSDDRRSMYLRLFESNFERILRKSELEGVPIVVVSVAGAMREGKSLLLYLIATYFRQEGWLKNSDWSKMLKQSSCCRTGMPSWSNGYQPGTGGVIAYGTPFILQRSDEEKIAVLLLDSEGYASITNTKEHHAHTFMLCSYLSALVVFNKRKYFNAETLENFQFLLTMAKSGSHEDDDIMNTLEKTAFMDLCVLMRDIPRSECRSGGKEYYKWLKSEVEKSDRSTLIKDCIEKTYKKFSFNCLPEPGQRIRDGECDWQAGLTVSDLGEEFCRHVNDLIVEYLHPNRLLEKYVTGKPHLVYASDLLHFVKTHGNSIIDGDFGAMSMIPTDDKMDRFRRKIQEKLSEMESPKWKDFIDIVGKYYGKAIKASEAYLSEAQQASFLNLLNSVVLELLMKFAKDQAAEQKLLPSPAAWKDFDEIVGEYRKQAKDLSKQFLSEGQQADFINRLEFSINILQDEFANKRSEIHAKLLKRANEQMKKCHGKHITKKKKIRIVGKDYTEQLDKELDSRDIGDPKEELEKLLQNHLDIAKTQNLKTGLKIAGIGLGCGIAIGATAGLAAFFVLPVAGVAAVGIAVGAGVGVAGGVGGGLGAAAAADSDSLEELSQNHENDEMIR